MKIFTLTLILTCGCATPISEVYDEARACGASDECQVLWDEWNEREERRLKRIAKRQPKCPKGQILVKTWASEGCVSAAKVREAMRRAGF